MDPVTIGAVILASIAAISAAVANIRFHSRCRAGENLEVSIQKRFKDDLGKMENPSLSSLSESES